MIGLDYPDAWKWEEFEPSRLLEVMRGFAAPWWVAGGWALDLWLGRETRVHQDVDLAILRGDQHKLYDTLPDWELCTTPPPTIGSCRCAPVSGSNPRSTGYGHVQRPTLHGCASSFSTSTKAPTGSTGVIRRCACRSPRWEA